MKKILVLCTGNSCRSQIAEGYLRLFASGKANVFSAGIETHGVDPKAIAVMQRDGIDISGHTSNYVTEYKDIVFDYVITVCDNASENCPGFYGNAERFHHNFPDPAKAIGSPDEILLEFTRVRNLSRDFSKNFIADKFPDAPIR